MNKKGDFIMSISIEHEIKKVYVVFKTHLDIGFTDLAETVTEQYMNEYIPAAINLGYELKDSKDLGFKWTTGSWLIYHYLRNKNGQELDSLIKAIEDGIIYWHGLPFTTHTELMDKHLFEYGLTLSEKLDKQFGRKTIAAKMTDVPGHTKAIIPLLAKAGIKFLHLGVNAASAVPQVPDFFTWVGTDGTEVVVCYSYNYGQDCILPCMKEALYFAHTPDNCGPQSKEMVVEQFHHLKEKYPNAEIVASTLDDFTESLLKYKDSLPKVYEELGDSWIHGAASDPLKVSKFRELLRLRTRWINEGKFEGFENELEEFSLNLLLIPEHTWGMDIKRHLGDYKNYEKKDFAEARRRDLIDDSAQMGLNWGFDNRSYTRYEGSWEEQREYLNKAIQALPKELQIEANESLKNLIPAFVESNIDYAKLNINEKYKFFNYTVEFDENGAISFLSHEELGTIFDKQNRCGLFVYKEIGKESYDFWFNNYIRDYEKNDWAYGDFGKPLFEGARTVTREHNVYLDNASYIISADNIKVVINVSSDRYAIEYLGCPEKIQIVYNFYADKIDLDLIWNGKDASRLPESIWFSINPKVDNPNMWFVEKMGELISPLQVVGNGGRNLHAIDSCIQYLGSEKKIKIKSLDAPLVAMGERKILKYDNSMNLSEVANFNLYNNIWGTNFRMWYDEDTKYRFTIELSK
jgi:hypothetical protein